MSEILFNDKLGNYTLKENISGVKSYKRVPIKFKFEDKTARFREEILENELNTSS